MWATWNQQSLDDLKLITHSHTNLHKLMPKSIMISMLSQGENGEDILNILNAIVENSEQQSQDTVEIEFWY